MTDSDDVHRAYDLCCDYCNTQNSQYINYTLTIYSYDTLSMYVWHYLRYTLTTNQRAYDLYFDY